MSERQDLALALCKADNQALTDYDEMAANLLAAGWVGPAENERMVARALARRLSIVRAERDALAATVQRVRDLCDEAAAAAERRGPRMRAISGDWVLVRSGYVSSAQLRVALAPSDPATEEATDG